MKSSKGSNLFELVIIEYVYLPYTGLVKCESAIISIQSLNNLYWENLTLYSFLKWRNIWWVSKRCTIFFNREFGKLLYNFNWTTPSNSSFRNEFLIGFSTNCDHFQLNLKWYIAQSAYIRNFGLTLPTPHFLRLCIILEPAKTCSFNSFKKY